MKRKLIVDIARHPTGDTYTFLDPDPVEDPACARHNDDETSAFAQYVLGHVKKHKDEASCEVLEYLKVESLTDALSHTIQALPAGKTRKLRQWIDEANTSLVYRYVQVHTIAQAAAIARIEKAKTFSLGASPLGISFGILLAQEGPQARTSFKTVSIQTYTVATYAVAFDAHGNERKSTRSPEMFRRVFGRDMPDHVFTAPREVAEAVLFGDTGKWRWDDIPKYCARLRAAS